MVTALYVFGIIGAFLIGGLVSWTAKEYVDAFIDNAAYAKSIVHPEMLDEDGNVVTPAKDAFTKLNIYNHADEAPEGATERNRKGIRYPELLSFIGAATEQRLTSIEARLDALEAE